MSDTKAPTPEELRDIDVAGIREWVECGARTRHGQEASRDSLLRTISALADRLEALENQCNALQDEAKHMREMLSYSISEPECGWTPREQIVGEERARLRPIAETLAMLDGNAFFMDGPGGEEHYTCYLPEAKATFDANGGMEGWSGLASFASFVPCASCGNSGPRAMMAHFTEEASGACYFSAGEYFQCGACLKTVQAPASPATESGEGHAESRIGHLMILDEWGPMPSDDGEGMLLQRKEAVECASCGQPGPREMMAHTREMQHGEEESAIVDVYRCGTCLICPPAPPDATAEQRALVDGRRRITNGTVSPLGDYPVGEFKELRPINLDIANKFARSESYTRAFVASRMNDTIEGARIAAEPLDGDEGNQSTTAENGAQSPNLARKEISTDARTIAALSSGEPAFPEPEAGPEKVMPEHIGFRKPHREPE